MMLELSAEERRQLLERLLSQVSAQNSLGISLRILSQLVWALTSQLHTGQCTIVLTTPGKLSNRVPNASADISRYSHTRVDTWYWLHEGP